MNKFLEPLIQLRVVNKNLRIALLAFILYLVTRLLADFPTTLYFLIEYQDFYNPQGFFEFENFLSLIALIAIYLNLRNNLHLPLEEKEEVISRVFASIFVVHYILQLFIFQKVIELRPITVKSLPSTIEELLPFDWWTIEYNFRGMLDQEYFGYDDFLELALAVISAASLILGLIALGLFLKSTWNTTQLKISLSEISKDFRDVKSKLLVAVLLILFLIISNERIQEDDYSTLTLEVQTIQESLVEFQGKLPKSTDVLTQTEIFEQRKFNAQYAYKDLVSNENRIRDYGFSIWSPDAKVLKIEVVEWEELWKQVLKELSLNGYTDKNSIFELDQKYKEISSLAIARAPRLAKSYDMDFWRDNFVALLTY